MKRRTFFIGDIHGALKALKQLISKLDLQPDDKLIFAGDYVDGWSESAQVIDYLIELAETYSCIFLKGNHDIWCEEWLKRKTADETWLFHGGMATVESYASYKRKHKILHLAFFERMHNYYIDDNNRLFIHAGFTSMHGPTNERYDKSFSWDRTLWEMAIAVDKGISKRSPFYPKRLLLFEEIFIGHTPTVNYGKTTPMQACNVWNIDTGAAFYGSLTSINIDTKEFWQTDMVQEYYPEEKGRNK